MKKVLPELEIGGRPRWRGPSTLEWAVIVSLVGVLCALLLPTNDYDNSHRFPPVNSRAGSAFANIAGDYHQGAVLGRSLSLSILADGRYSFVWGTCTGIHHRESGYVGITDGIYFLMPVETVATAIDRTFLPIRWSDRLYLVPPNRLEGFCDAIIDATEPRSDYPGRFYLRFPCHRVTGYPSLPKPWATYLEQNLVIGKVLDVNGANVRIDVGSKSGLHERDVLKARRHDYGQARKLSVASVAENSCVAREFFPDEAHPLEPGTEVVFARNADKP